MVTLQLLLILLALVVVAFLSGIETGIVAINRLRLMHKARNGERSALIIEGFLRDTDRLLGTTLVGSNLMSVAIATLAAALTERYWGHQWQVVTSLLVALLVLVLGEFMPKAWFTSRPLERCLTFARPLQAVEFLLQPLARFCTLCTTWLAAGNRQPQRSQFVTREHLHLLTQASEAGGQISTFERLMISRVLDMQMKTAAEIMTPLRQVAAVDERDTIADALEKVRQQGRMKLPVFAADGRCLGVVPMQQVLALLPGPESDPVVQYMKPPFFIADTVRADDVLPLLRRQRQRIAMIRNSAGEVLGIVTIENVLKILIGNLPATASGERKAEPSPAIVTPPPQLLP